MLSSGGTDAFTNAFVGGDGVRWPWGEGMLEEMLRTLCKCRCVVELQTNES